MQQNALNFLTFTWIQFLLLTHVSKQTLIYNFNLYIFTILSFKNCLKTVTNERNVVNYEQLLKKYKKMLFLYQNLRLDLISQK